MRTRSVVLGLTATLATGCYAALPPPSPPHIVGVVAVSGGTLGSWRMTPTAGRPVDRDDIEALDLVDPSAPTHVLRLVRAPAAPEERPRGFEEVVASRGVELRLATTGDGAAEVVLDRAHCPTLEAIFRFTHGHAFGSARFECDLGAQGHATGDVEFAAGGSSMMNGISGQLEASDATLAGVRFEPDEAETDPRGVMFWDRRRPRVVFELEQLPADPSVLGAGSNARLHVTSTSERVASFDLEPSACRQLSLERSEGGYIRVGKRQHTFWSGTLAIDCATPAGGRITGNLVLR